MKTLSVKNFAKKVLGISACLFVGASLSSSSAYATKMTRNWDRIELRSELANPVVEAGQKQTTFLKVSLKGFSLENANERTPANIAIVLDKSGSMNGEKIQSAKQAARMAVDLLNDNDILSIITYDSTVNVIVPATKVSDKQSIHRAIDKMSANGNTALFAGVSKGAAEIRKFIDKDRVNRVILLSDGQANMGPSSPTELGDLGASLSKDGISVTTIGLGTGYNEDLMANLAGYSDGNHAFVENAADLAKVFKYEFGDVLSVVAQDVEINIRCGNGVRPIRILGRDGTILGQNVRTTMNQLYSDQEKFVLIEVEVPAGRAKEEISVADVSISYQNMQSRQKDNLADNMKIAYSASQEEVKKALNAPVVSTATKQIVNESSKKALKLRDQGLAKEAQAILQESVSFSRSQGALLGGEAEEELNSLSDEVAVDADNIVKQEDWNKNRKELKAKQYNVEKQQSYK